jgi:hypothetical protein
VTKRVFGEQPESTTHFVAFVHRDRQTSLPRRPSIWWYFRTTRFRYVLAAPAIYGMAIPLLLLDVSATVYQYVCSVVYGIPRVRRSDYLVIDRHRLPYLNPVEKIHCLYCSYANQLVEYAREINARSEQFFCPIKHARRTMDPHRRTARFFEYGDARAYHQNLGTIRKDWDE